MSNENQQGTGTAAMPTQSTAGGRNEANIISAKRKFWIEWECLLDKFPTEAHFDQLDRELRRYIADYLDKLSTYKGKEISDEGLTGSGIFAEILGEINEAFSEEIFVRGAQSNNVPIEYSKWDKGAWNTIIKDEYGKVAIQNLERPPGNKTILKYTVYTKKWMSIFKSDWKRVSDSHLVFSYRGWFVTRNNIRLTNENRGSMNPPPPPPPPPQ